MKNTDQLKSDLYKLEGDSSELEKKVKAVDDNLIYVHDKLSIPETLHDRLSTLDSSLKMASDLLGVVRIIPPIGAAASNTKRVIDLFRKPVSQAKKVSGNVDKRVKPIRTKVHKVEQEVAKLDNELKSIISKEQSLIRSVNHAQTCIASLPSGAVKAKSTGTLESSSAKAAPPVGVAVTAQHAVLEAANAAENKINQIKKDVQSLVEIDASISQVMKVLNPLINQLMALKRAFNVTIRVPYGGFPKMCKKKVWPGITTYYPCGWHTTYFSFSIQQILNGVSGVVRPVMDLLDKAMYAVLNPLLKALNLNIKLPAIPGLDKLKDIIDSLASVLDPLTKTFNQLMKEAKALQEKLQALFKFTQQFNKIYQACVHGRAEEPAAAIVMEANLAETDPQMFDALATLHDRTYLFRGKLYWFYSPEQDDAEGPFAIADEFGKDGRGKPLAGPFDAACVVDDRLCLFQGKNYYLCTPGENGACKGPMPIKGHWGKTKSGQPLSGPFDAAFSLHGRVFLFRKKQFYISTGDDNKMVSGPRPIKGYWGNNDKGAPLEGPFDAATVHADRLFIRKGELFWDQSLNRIKALASS